MGNLGIAKVKAGLSDSMAGISPNPKRYSFDTFGSTLIQESKGADKSRIVGFETTNIGGSQSAVMHLKKSIYKINNYIEDSTWINDPSTRHVEWISTTSTSDTILADYLPEEEDTGDTGDTGDTTNEDPTWTTRTSNAGARAKASASDEGDGDDVTSNDNSGKYAASIAQTTIKPDILWGVETEEINGAEVGLGYWLTIQKDGDSKIEQESVIYIDVNNDADDGFAIIIDEEGGFLLDMQDQQEGEDWNKIPLVGLSNASGAQTITIGFMPILGRLNIICGGQDNLYERSRVTGEDEADEADEADEGDEGAFNRVPFLLKIEKFRVFGTNCTVRLYLSAMTFAATGICITSISAAPDADGNATVNYKGSSDGMTEDGEIWEFPHFEGEKGIGVCASNISNVGPGASETCPVGMGEVEFTWVSSGSGTGKVLQIDATAESRAVFGDVEGSGLNVGTPYIYRLKGIVAPEDEDEEVEAEEDLDLPVIKMTETMDTPDLHHVTHSMDVTVYNPDGDEEDSTTKAKGITVKMGWGTASETVFSGVTLDSMITQVAGLETVTFKAEDGMRVLNDTVVLNSPYYDGMLAIDAITELASRAGVAVINDVPTDQEYYLPAGYTFSEPRLRFDSSTGILECCKTICKMSERCMAFDADGQLHISGIEGGIAFDTAFTPSATFTSDPSGEEDENIIIDQKVEEYLVGSVVNRISVASIDRTSLHRIYVVESDTEPKVPYLKVLFYDQPAFGSLSATRNWVSMLQQRVFKIPRRIRFKTISEKTIAPLAIVKVDTKLYRVRSMSRNYDAATNSLTTEISGEWMGT